MLDELAKNELIPASDIQKIDSETRPSASEAIQTQGITTMLDTRIGQDPHTTLKTLAGELDETDRLKTQEHNRQYFLASPDHFVLNAGHTDGEELRALSQSLTEEDAAEFIDEDGKTYMVLHSKELAEYLHNHQEDMPHAVADICTLVSEELKQFVSPKKQIKDLQDVEQDLEDDPEDEDLIDDRDFLKKSLQETLTVLPGQQLGIINLLTNEQFEAAMFSYIDTFAQVQRIANGLQTNQTHGQYLDGVLEDIKTQLLKQKEQIKSSLDDAEFLTERGLPLPNADKLEDIKL